MNPDEQKTNCDSCEYSEVIAERDPWKHRSLGMKCKTCMWYVQKNNSKMVAIGRCRRHSPSMSGYPVVYEYDWCGDHKLNEEAI